MKKMIQTIAYKTLYAIAYAASMIPMTLLYAIASCAFFFTYYIFGYRKAVVIQNMARSFPDKRYAEIHCMVKKFYSSFADYFAEITKSISSPAVVLEKKIIFENLELIDRHVRAGRSVIACMGHCGNWEMLNFMPYKLRHDIYAIYKPLQSGVMNRLMIKLRSRFGMQLIRDTSVVRHMVNKRSIPGVYLFLADQCPRIQDKKYQFELLNQEAYIFSGMEKLARISGSAVIYLHITKLSKGNYNITCVPVCSNATATNEGEITKTMLIYSPKILKKNHTAGYGHTNVGNGRTMIYFVSIISIAVALVLIVCIIFFYVFVKAYYEEDQ